jgi:hypothetical protein
MEIFLSYARPDRLRADAVAQRLRQAGNNVWLDTGKARGQAWWEEILRQLRLCDAAVVVVSRASLRSQACIRERHYAASLGKAILPLTIEPLGVELLPSDLARLQVIDYSQPDEAAAFQLAGAIIRLPEPRALPDPLPNPPSAPTSALDNVAEQLKAPSLDQDQQLAVIGRLESALAPSADPNDRSIALEMLGEMEKRDDLFAAVDRRIAALRSSLDDTGASDASEMPPRPQEPPSQQAAQPTDTDGKSAVAATTPTPHWVMAIVSLIFFFPLGIAAVILAQRTRASLITGDLETARKSANIVKILFWIVVAIYVLVGLSRT